MSASPRTILVESVRLADLLWLSAQYRNLSGGVRWLALYSISRPARFAARLARLLGTQLCLEELNFDYVDDVVLPDGTAGKDELLVRACPSIVESIEGKPAYEAAIRQALRDPAHEPWVRVYLSKRIFMELSRNEYPQPRSVTIAAWYGQTRWDRQGGPLLLYVQSRWCDEGVAGYGARWGIEVRPLPRRFFALRRGLGSLRRLLRVPFRWAQKLLRPGEIELDPAGTGKTPPLRIAVDCYSQGITRDPLCNTEWFWYRNSVLPPGAVFAYFHHPYDLVTESRRAWLRGAGIGWVDEEAGRRLKRSGPSPAWRRPRLSNGMLAGSLQEALEAFGEDFYDEYAQWSRFFRATNTRIHVSAFDMFAESEALHAALSDRQGISISLQRSIEADPNLRRRTVSDVHFGFSRAQAVWERQSGSTVGQFVTAGYPFDAAFPAAEEYGRKLAAQLKEHGVKFTVSFFDQNLGVHPKWLGGQRMLLNDYGFLCERLEQDPSLGLILKPKRPRTLPQRLGPLWPRLQRLIESGRCVMLSGDSVDEAKLPCAAACASDVAVNWIAGGTAGLESALAGKPTLLIRHRYSQGEFHSLEGSVAFQDWPELWRAVERLRANPKDPAIGNWGPLIEQYASLRDGKASERMEAYVRWLYEALAAGRSKEQALKEARENYRKAWGEGWIEEVRPEEPAPVLAEVGT